MYWLRRIWHLFNRSAREQEIEDELRSHFEMRVEDNVARGLDAEDAKRDAQLRLGNPVALREQTLAIDVALGIETFWRDLHYAVRQLRRTPVFTVTAVATLALGIGATTAIFTLIHALLLNSLPVWNPAELYRIGNQERCCVDDALQNNWSMFSYDQYRTFRDSTQGFSNLAAFEAGRETIGLRRAGSAEPALPKHAEFVSGNAFETLGVQTFLGRPLIPRDDTKAAAPVAVMSYRLWKDKYNGDRGVVGQSFFVDAHPFTIVGIAPPGFIGENLQSDPPDLWLPLSSEPVIDPTSHFLDLPQVFWLNLIGRLPPGQSPIAVQSQLRQELRLWLEKLAGAPLSADDRRVIAQQTLSISPGGGGIRQTQEDFG